VVYNYIKQLTSQLYRTSTIFIENLFKIIQTHLKTHANVEIQATTSVVIGTDHIGSSKSNYHTITATTAPIQKVTILKYIQMGTIFNVLLGTNLLLNLDQGEVYNFM
jgi:hypothetical protein